MRNLKKFVKITLITLLSLVLLLVLAALAILQWPSLVINEPTLRWAAKYAPRYGAELHWDAAKVDVTSYSLFEKRLDIDFDNLCVGMTGYGKNCFTQFRFGARAAYTEGAVHLTKAGPIQIEGENIQFALPALVEEKSETETETQPIKYVPLELPALFRDTAFENVEIHLKNSQFRMAPYAFSGNLDLSVKPVEGQSNGFLDLVSNKTCITHLPTVPWTCYDSLQLSGKLDWTDGKLKIVQAGPGNMEKGQALVMLEKVEETEPRPAKLELELPELVRPQVFKDTRLEKISFDFSKVDVRQGDQSYSGTLKAESFPAADGTPSVLNANLTATGDISGSLNLKLESPSEFKQNDWHLNVDADIQMKSGIAANGQLALVQTSPKHFSFSLNGHFKSAPYAGEAKLQGSLSPGALDTTVSGELGGFSEQVHKVSATNCHLQVQDSGTAGRVRVNADCPLRAHLNPVKLPSPAHLKWVTIPYNLDFLMKTEMTASLAASMKEMVKGTLDLELKPVSQELLAARGKTKTEFSGIPAQYPNGWSIVSDLDLFVQLHNFQKLAQALKKTAYPVPAPLGVLDGTAEIGLKGKTDISHFSGNLPVEFNTRLHSAQQKFDTDGKGVLNFKRIGQGYDAKLDMELALSDLKISLPRYGYSSLPNLFPDARITTGPKLEGPLVNTKYQIRIYSPEDKPVRLVSNLAKEDIPLYFDVTADPKDIKGFVRVGTAPLRFFRRDARIESFKLALREPTDLSEVNGKIRVSFADYQIDVIILGTVRKPRVIFQSNPPLPDEQIISYLIYGRTFDELDANQSNSVADTSGALGDRAVTLASLFLLASTPIESVSYNPATGQFSAKIKLAEGTSLSLGTHDGKTQELGIRKALGRNWIVNTYIENDSEDNEQKGGAFLEYYKRY